MTYPVPILMGLLTGAGFGWVLYKVGATRYSRVMGMLTVRDTKVMKFAFTCIATASVLYGVAATTGLAEPLNLVPRVMPFMGWAHVLGGLLFGVSMGTWGLCPGTCVAKAAGRGGEKAFTGTASIIGLLAGIVAYAWLKQPLTDVGIIATNQKPITLYGLLGLPYGAVALMFGAVILLVIYALDALTTERRYEPAREAKTWVDRVRGEWTWLASGVTGGILIVLATAQGGYLGFSGAALAVVGSLSHLFGVPMELVPKITTDIAWRAALLVGVFPGAMIAHAISIPSAAAVAAPVKKVFSVPALGGSFTAGATMALGAMIGGGCTTGAFLSAWPTLSIGSFAMAGTFFAVSMGTSIGRSLLNRLDLPQAQVIGDRVYD
jgi:hypothetical protein